jgi:hypothetical protein
MRVFTVLAVLSFMVAMLVGCTSDQPQTAGNPLGAQPVQIEWFPGMLNPPRVLVHLPEDFTCVSTNGRDGWNMYQGVTWSEPGAAEPFTRGNPLDLSQIKKPLFWVHLSSEVGQIPGTDTFTNEAGVKEAAIGAGIRDVEIRKYHWGAYPLLSFTGTRPNGTPVRVVWVGINRPEGWALIIDYRVPHSDVYSPEDAETIWRNFLEQTRPRD